MTTMTMTEARQSLDGTTGFFRHWIGVAQRNALHQMLRGEEGDFFRIKLTELKNTIDKMPKTYETEAIDGKDKIVHLHYFTGPIDAWVVEKDMGDGSGDLLQLQAYGKQCLTGDKSDAEWGYISIQELIDNDVEIDLYWTPKPMGEV